MYHVILYNLSNRLTIKVHISCVVRPKKPERHTVGILTGRKKMSFSHFCISVIPYPIGTKVATELPTSQGSLHTKFEGNCASHFQDTSCQSLDFFSCFFFLFCFRTRSKIAINANAYSDYLEIWHTERESKANPSITFGANPMNGSGVMTNYSCKTRSICCHAYRANRFME